MNPSRTIAISILFFIIPAALTAQERWRLLLISGEADSVFIDTQTVRKLTGAQQWQVWTKGVFPAGELIAGKRYHHIISLDQVDCLNDRTRTKDAIFYYLDGEVAHQSEPPETWPAWQDPVPDTVREFIHKHTCQYVRSTIK